MGERRRPAAFAPGCRLLAVTAHPDDESATFGGTLALYAARGVAVDVVSVTRGEAARNRPNLGGEAVSNEELAALRSGEFRRACELLGVSWCEIWDYPDGRLNDGGFDKIAHDLSRVMRERRPHFVLAMGPEGGFTGHPDHSAVSRLTQAGFFACLKQGEEYLPERLFYATAPGPLPGYPPLNFSPITMAIDISETFERKMQAFECHRTQAPLFARFRAAVRHYGEREYFHLAWPKAPDDGQVRDDLFAAMQFKALGAET